MDAVSVVDLEGPHPRVIAHVTVEDAPEGLATSPNGKLAVVANVNGSNMKQAWFHHPNGSITFLQIGGKTVTPLKTVEVGAFPEAIVFTPDGRYVYVGNFSDQDFSILKVVGADVIDMANGSRCQAIRPRHGGARGEQLAFSARAGLPVGGSAQKPFNADIVRLEGRLDLLVCGSGLADN
jgi:DNA-binding beta-propeller fold protein YncE